jgi:hypothetical protein
MHDDPKPNRLGIENDHAMGTRFLDFFGQGDWIPA